jgi:acyl-CoA reductase-like NAD-dependent aldehyde dehydrogenase
MEEKVFFFGKWQEGKDYFEVKNPYTQKILWKFPSLTPQDVEKAISFLEKNKKIMKEMPKFKRAEILENVQKDFRK